MSVDVIIPLYDGAPWIQEALNSVLAQELMPNEIVVVDDGSTDNSPDLVRAYQEVKLLRNPKKGSATARNFGLLHTKSPLVAFLDQDDVWHPAHLRLLVKCFQNNSDANTVFSTANAFSEDPPKYKLTEHQIASFDPWTRFPFTIGVDGPSLALIKRSVLQKVGMWEEQSTGMADALLFLKLSSLHPLQRLTSCTVGKRIHEGQQWLRVRAWGAEYLDFRFKVMQIALDFRRVQRPMDPMLSLYERRLESLKTLREITRIISSTRFEAIPLLARQFELELSDDPPGYIRHAFYCLMGALFPIHDTQRLRLERDQVFSKLLEVWPEVAPRTQAAIRSVIGDTPLVS